MMVMSFLNKDTGKMFINCNDLYGTSDGGKSWTSIKNDMYCTTWGDNMQFLNENNGYIVSGQCIMHTLDGGQSWNKEISVGKYGSLFTKVQMMDANTGYAIDIINGYIYKRN